MPLLYKKDFAEKSFPPGLKDSDEVFFCELTNEVFTDYEEFCERIYLCNSLVWSCSITGRSNLTYLEALDSEQTAKKQLSEIPLTLRIPIFFLITISNRKSLSELAEDIFMFVRDRYFVGETVEVCCANETWCDCHIIQVTYPTDKVIQEYKANHTNNNNNHGSNSNRDYWPPPALYSYEVEIVNNANKDGLTYFVRGDQVRRRKGLFTRDKNKLLIKQFVCQVDNIWKLRDDVYKKYAIERVKFDEIFAGDPANLYMKKKASGKENINNKLNSEKLKREKKQESIQKYFKQKSSSSPSKSSNVNHHNANKKLTPSKNQPAAVQQKTLIQKLKNKYKGVQNGKKTNLMNKINNKKEDLKEKIKNKKKSDEEAVKKSLTKDELLKLAFQCKDKDNHGLRNVGDRMKLNKENRQQLAELIKELNKRREDLECEDLKELPEPTAIKLAIPNECFGDFVQILEFLHSFGRVINMKNFFPFGVSMELVERALTAQEVAGPFNDILQLLLTAIFDLQEQHFDDMNDSSVSTYEGVDGEKNKYEQLIAFSNAAASYSQQFQGVPLSQLTLDCATITEILRLHFLSSGRFRCQDDFPVERNGLNLDDPGRNLCLNNPNLLKLLAQKSVFELAIEQKIEVINCLIDQILMFTSIRETIDERGEKIKAGRMDLRTQQAAEIKKKKEALLKAKEQLQQQQQQQQQQANGALPAEQKEQQPKDQKDALPKDNRSRKDLELARKARDLSDAEMEYQVLPLGADRAYRRFWMFSSMPGLFVEDDEVYPGFCLPKGTPYAEDADACLKYVRKLFEDGGPSNKENLIGVSKDHVNISTPMNTGSPSKKMLVEKNGSPPADTASSSTNSKSTPSRSNSKIEVKNACKPLTCWGDPLTCPIHGPRPDVKNRTVWSFYKNESDVDNLIASLNSRGYRESKLKKTLVQERQRIIDSLAKCQFSKLDPNEVGNELNEMKKSSRSAPKYDKPNLDFPSGTPANEVLSFSLRDMILEMEEKIHEGLLGSLKVNSREEWRKALRENEYDRQCDVLKWSSGSTATGVNTEVNSCSNTLADKIKEEIKEQEGAAATSVSRSNTPTSQIGIDKLTKTFNSDLPTSANIYNMACAILQLLQAVDPRYLKKPFESETDNANQDTSPSTTSPTSTSSTQNDDQPSNKKRKSKLSVRERWEQSLMESNSLSQLFIHFYTLENSIEWAKSALKTYSCKVCRQRDPEKMLLCDMCNKGFHMYCLKPKLIRVPEGDWYCAKCQEKHDKAKATKERSSSRRQPQAQDDEVEKNEPEGVIGKCKVCRTKGEVAVCDECNGGFHLECVSPPLRKYPRFTWTCPNCRHQGGVAAQSTTNKRSSTKDKHDKTDSDFIDDDSSNDDDNDVSGSDDNSSNDVERCPSRRRCAKTATAKISRFAKQLRTNSWDGDPDDLNKDGETGTSSRRRSRRSMETSSDMITTTSSKDLPLDNAALQEILDIVMHHKDAWPFLRPVTRSEVPDYHTIIKTPMDFGTIKHKLNMLEYNKNSQVIADAMLVFDNCYTYNQADTEVFKAGERLQKVFEKLCIERKMKLNHRKSCDDNQEDEIRPPNGKKPRTVF